MNPSGIAGELTSGTKDPMTGNNDRNGVAPYCRANGLSCAGGTQLFCDLAVC